MDQIADGEMTKESVVGDSRKLLHKTTDKIEESREDLAKVVWAGMDKDRILGPCEVCEEAGRAHEDGAPNRLRIIELKGGKRMYGCEGWKPDDPESPDSCPVSGPLPRPRLRAVAARGALLDLRRDAAADRQGLPRPPLEALPQRRLPDDGRDAREEGRAPGRPGSQEGDGRGTARRKADGQESTRRRRRRPRGPTTTVAAPGAGDRAGTRRSAGSRPRSQAQQ